ncbi:ABC transporter substrate-binding protein [Desulfovibrio sp. JC022]|uniref:substrate-binding periplasmic protein n=1 Tax=Desulfovibrio sp. JC022 TaxID=2593642 RepID=UPI0013D504BD|nr:transporter substrate-binding domain-containing protein [Desulfovibrio sp. JC022]NDV23742.1 transporter substrate-binding domain-containing protein [Desulfovibrio sp. JC022]
MKKFFYLITKYITSVLSILLLLHGISYADPLTIGYIELPPYYFTNAQHQPDGFLLHLTKKIMNKAGCECTYKSMPSKRILHTIRKGGSFASIGWFKTQDREEYAKFSQPIYKNKPIGIFLRKKDYKKFSRHKTLKELLEQNKFKTGYIAGHSMGKYIDTLLDKHSHSVHALSGTTQQLVRMLHDGSIDFCLLAPIETSKIIQQSSYREDEFYFMSMADITKGNTRHLIFSRNVSDETIEKINTAIDEIMNETDEHEID